MKSKKWTVAGLLVLSALGFQACNSGSGEGDATDTTATVTDVEATTTTASYVDLGTGQTVEVRFDENNRNAINLATNEPLEFYVDANTLDTFYGKTGTVVNNAIWRTEEGKYKLDDNKVKWDGDDLKIKYADGSKLKTDEDGDRKFKSENGDLKIKQKDGEVKVKKDGEVIHKTEGYNK